jgi:hypothetical protein
LRPQRDIRIGIAGLTIFSLGLLSLVSLSAALISGLDGGFPFDMLGTQFNVPGIQMGPALLLGTISVGTGFAVMTGRAYRRGLAVAFTWIVLGLVGWTVGAPLWLLLVPIGAALLLAVPLVTGNKPIQV